MNVKGHVMFATKKISPGGHWMNITHVACKKANADFTLSAEAYARVAVALMDGFISCWDEKYRTRLIRPETYINQYIDESWIKDTETGNMAVMLLPRMKQWIDENYPGTKIAISEYNWGGHEHINGALALADVLGIFGREDVGLATLWSPPSSEQPAAFAFRIYRNYNGAGASFGDISVQAISSDQELVSSYAAQRSSDGALTIVLINKSRTSQNVQLTFNRDDPGAQASLYRYSANKLDQIEQLSVSDYHTLTLPRESITLVEIHPSVTEQNERVYLPAVYNEK